MTKENERIIREIEDMAGKEKFISLDEYIRKNKLCV
jgi:hypothetical protein